ncbi:MAG: gliding motility-associated C-terminal domain-containing protein [Flavobacteriales bacterium]
MTTLKHQENDSLYSYIQIPNGFTPDGDGTNDFYNVTAFSLAEYELKISNASGELVYVTQILHPQHGWYGDHKGVKAASGKYFYHLWAKDYTGFEYDHNGEIYLVK